VKLGTVDDAWPASPSVSSCGSALGARDLLGAVDLPLHSSAIVRKRPDGRR
jgi:hypothetical protein